jgi:PAS domain S-box-containing protein
MHPGPARAKSPILDERVPTLRTQRKQAEARMREETVLREELEQEVARRTAELRHANAVLRAEAARNKRARATERAADARFAHVFRASPVAMALSSAPDGTFWDVNDSWQALCGFKRADVIGRTARELKLFPDDAWLAGQAGPADCVLPVLAERDVRMRRRDGAPLDILLSGARIGKVAGGCFLTILRDATAQRQRELEVRTQREQLTYLSRVVVLGELCGAIAHELNQPLAAILANAQAGRRWLARQPQAAAMLGDILDDIVAADQRAASVIRRLRTLFMQGESTLRPLDLNEVARAALVLAASSLAEHQVQVEAALAPGLPVVRGDPVQLQQVLLNLIVNGCDAMRVAMPGPRRLAIGSAAAPPWGVQLTVSDSGPGIGPDALEKVFDSFFTTKVHGLGFGLSVSRAIIVAHGGRIEAANNATGGAVFRITLPVASGEA